MIYSPGTSPDVLSGFTPSAVVASAEAKPAEPSTPAAEPPKTEEPAKSLGSSSLAEQIRADREARLAREKAVAEQTDYKAKLAEAEAKIAELSKTSEIARRDIVAHLTALGFTAKDLATAGESIMYHLVPDQAPPDIRIRTLEARLDRERREAEEAEQRKAQEADKRRAEEAAQEAERMQAEYVESLRTVVETAESTGLVHSVAWFADSHAEYTESLLRTAQNLATTAQAQGKVADLSPANVAAVLEKHLLERASRVKTIGVAAPATPPAPAKSFGAPASTPPQVPPPPPPAPTSKPLSDRERLARAVSVAFKN